MWTRMVTLALGKFSSSWCFLKIYTADKNFTQPPVAPVAPNINSDIIVIKHQERISINWCDWWKTMYFCWARARQTHNRQCPPSPSPPPLICMHNLVIVLYVTTMTTSNAFGGTQCKNIRIWLEQTISNVFSLSDRQPKLHQHWQHTKIVNKGMYIVQSSPRKDFIVYSLVRPKSRTKLPRRNQRPPMFT